MTNLYYTGKIKGLSEINLPMKNEFGCETSVLGEVHLLIKAHIVQQNGSSGACAEADVPWQDLCSPTSSFGLDSVWSVLGRRCGVRSFLLLCEEKTNIVPSCYISSPIKLWLVMIALHIFQSQKWDSCSFHRLLDFLAFFFSASNRRWSTTNVT